MAYKDPEKNKAAKKKWYLEHKDYYKKHFDNRIARHKTIVREAKNVPCMDCRQIYPFFVMDFDHRDDVVKDMEISKLVRYGTKRLLEEIAKCEVVCANCHRIRTNERMILSQNLII